MDGALLARPAIAVGIAVRSETHVAFPEAIRLQFGGCPKARKRWHEDGDKHAFSLSATTGSGKTVMAAAVIEALFFGNDEFEFEADPGAVVIWFSDDPSLNEQSKWRLRQASDKLTVSDLITVESTFGRERFEPGKVYFLNTQKLGRNSLLVRGHDLADTAIEKDDRQMPIMPDMRSHTIWDTIRNTIEDPDLTLYLVLDEAHRGMRDGGLVTATGRPTIVRQLINGSGSVPGIPVVWGISATVQRFNAAIEGMTGHDTLRPVVVDTKKVQDSGLINSIMFPTIFTLTLERSGVSQSSTSGLLCVAICGGALLPMAVGAIADSLGLRASFVIPLAAYSFIICFAAVARTRPNEESFERPAAARVRNSPGSKN